MLRVEPGLEPVEPGLEPLEPGLEPLELGVEFGLEPLELGVEFGLETVELGLELGLESVDAHVECLAVVYGKHSVTEFVTKCPGQSLGPRWFEAGFLQAIGEPERVDH